MNTPLALSSTPCPHRIVRASAGTGKTYDLATRYLSLLRTGVEAEHILASTFTRKAAGEILERVLTRLAEAAKNNDDAAQLASDLGDPTLDKQACINMLAALCRSLHRVSISTLDSFFHQMATCFRHELGIPPQFRLVGNDDPTMTQLRREAIDAMLGDEDLPTLVEMLRHLHQDTNRRSVTESINTVVKHGYEVFLQNPQRELWSRITVPGVLLDKPAIAEAIIPLRDLAGGMTDRRWAKALRSNREAAEAGDWGLFLEKGFAMKLASGESQFAGKDIPAKILAVFGPLIEHAKAELISRIVRQTLATHRLLQRFDEHFTRLRHEHGVLMYSDIPLKLLRDLPALDGDRLADIYYRLDARVTHLLLDEFQDTSLDQWRVLLPFAQEICAHSDGSRTFYCVGDVKQAIYGWRGGCAEIFNQIEHDLHLPDGAHRSKSKSYRSSQIVLDSVNRLFSQLTNNPVLASDEQAAARWQQCFEPHTTHKKDPGYVELTTSPKSTNDEADLPTHDDPDDDSSTAPQAITAHEEYAADRIARIASETPGRTIGVLVNTNKTGRTMVDLLRRRGMGASGEGNSLLTDDPAVLVILSALTLADHPGDTAAAFHVMHSPLGPIVGLGGITSRNRHGVSVTIRRALLTQGYAGLIADWTKQLAPACDGRNVWRLSQLMELADRYDPAITLRPGDFVRFVQSTPIEEPSDAPIRIMTINKAKGLEFDLVVLPDLNRDLLQSSSTPSLYIHRDAPLAPVRGVYCGANKDIRPLCPQLENAYRQWRSHQLQDDLSKLYVAMTRAKQALYMIVKPLSAKKDRKKDGDIKADGWSTLSFAAILRRGLSSLGEDEGFDGCRTLYQHGQPDWAHQDLPTAAPLRPQAEPLKPLTLRLATPNEKTARRSWQKTSPSSLESAGRVWAGDLLMVQESNARQHGRLIHAWLEQITWLNPAEPEETGITNDVWLAIARPEMPDQNDTQLRTQLDAFKQMLTQPTVIKALSRPVLTDDDTTLRLWRERGFAVRANERLIEGKFDRVVIYDRNGTPKRADLIDFKTDRITPDTLGRAVEQYHPQIAAYVAALSAMLRLPPASIRAELLFVRSGDRVVWTPKPASASVAESI